MKRSDTNEPQIIDFGRIKCGESDERELVIKNMSAIATRVSLRMENFRLIHEEDKITLKPKKTNKISERYRLEEPTNGIGFGFELETIELAPFEQRAVTVYVLAELWGEYTDTVLVAADGVASEYRVAMVCRVDGAPVRLYTGRMLDQDEPSRVGGEIPVVRFGSLVQGAAAVTSAGEYCHVRKLQIQNTCRVPIEIEWNAFLTEPDDQQLLDLNLIYPDIEEAPSSSDDSTSALEDNRMTTDESSRFLREKISPIKEQDSTETTNTALDFYDQNYLQLKYFPVVRVHLSNHYGRKIDERKNVFFLNEYRSLLKPREKTTLNISFNSNVPICRNFEATFVGYLKLAQNFVEGPGFRRNVGFDWEPIRFKATGTLESPNLVVEFDNEDLSFRTAIGDLIQVDNFEKGTSFISNEKIYKNSFSLFNNSLAPVEFSLSVNSPFSLNNETSAKNVIKPKSKLKFDVLFKLDTDLIRRQKFTDGSSRVALLRDHITIGYGNDMCQRVNVTAKIYAPEFAIRPVEQIIDFGTCLIDQERCQQLIIKNPSFSSLIWSIRIEEDSDSVFRCDTSRGLLEADKDFINKTEQVVNVFFTARHNKSYSAKLVICARPSVFGSEYVNVELNGIGTADQKHEAILNV